MRNMPDVVDELAIAINTIAVGLQLWPSKVSQAVEIYREEYHPEDRSNDTEKVIDDMLTILKAEFIGNA